MTPVTTASGPLYYMFSRQGVPEEAVRAFDAALDAMRADDTFQRILNRFAPTGAVAKR